MDEQIVHATTVFIEGGAVLIMGDSGVGKSFLALRLILDRGAILISDDMTVLSIENGQLYASCVTMHGSIEVHSIGILKNQPFVERAPVSLVLMLSEECPPRLPLEQKFMNFLGCDVPMFELHAKENGLDVRAYIAVKVAQKQMELLNCFEQGEKNDRDCLGST